MTDRLRQIVYASTAARDAGTDTIHAILTTSRRNNARDAVTGLLYADGERFMQALEGPGDAVAATFARITADDRHRNIETLVDREIAAREFGNWSMAYAAEEDDRAAADAQMRRALIAAAPDVRARFRELVADPTA